MIIEKVHVQNFRCIKDEALSCSNQTALVGPNGCGKSSFLRAIDLFYELTTKITDEDFYNKNIDDPIIIRIAFSHLTHEERKLYDAYLNNESLTIEKHIRYPGGRGYERYYGSKLQNPSFQKVREATSATEKRNEYDTLHQEYSGLATVRKAEDIEKNLVEWEKNNPTGCQMMLDAGQFFGFREVGNARLDRFTKFFLVPAVRDASEEVRDRKGSHLTDLLDLVVMEAVKNNKELEELRTAVNVKYKEIVNPAKLPELPKLEDDLTHTLQTYVSNAKVKLEWILGEPDIPIPGTNAQLVEDDYQGDVTKKGHGLQRAFILTLLQHLAVVRANLPEEQENVETVNKETIATTSTIPNLVIAIEEPELYQHPNRQRHLANVFTQLTEAGIGGVERVQIIYSTHSPLFVGIEKFDNIRIFRKIGLRQGEPKETKTKFSTISQIASRLDEYVHGTSTGKFTADSLKAHLKNIMNPTVNEGFFSNVLVLVEGESDQYAILEVALQTGKNLEKEGISVIPVRGKTNMPSLFLIFTSLGIPTYIVFDCDKSLGNDAHADINKLLFKMCNCPEEEFPKTNVTEKEAHFEENLENIFREELGEETYKELLTKHCKELGYNRKDGEKNPIVVCNVIRDTYISGKKLSTLEKIVDVIIKLKS